MRRNAPTCLEKHLENKVRGLLKTRKLRTMLNTHGRRRRMRSMPLSLVMLFFTSVSNRLVIDTSVSIYLHLDSNVRLWTKNIIGICLLQSRSKIYVYVYIYIFMYLYGGTRCTWELLTPGNNQLSIEFAVNFWGLDCSLRKRLRFEAFTCWIYTKQSCPPNLKMFFDRDMIAYCMSATLFARFPNENNYLHGNQNYRLQ